MTKAKTLLFTSISVIFIMLFVIGTSLIYESLDREKADVRNLGARRDDLLAQQQSIENVMEELNKTLAYEIVRQEKLAAQLENLAKEKNILIEQQQAAAATPPPPPPTPVVVTPTTTTRAS